MTTADNYQQTLEAFVKHINEQRNIGYGPFYPEDCKEVLEVRPGTVNDKIVSIRPGAKNGSAFCFIRKADGAILKSATWTSPAKGVRGYITDPNFGWGKAVGPYGAASLR